MTRHGSMKLDEVRKKHACCVVDIMHARKKSTHAKKMHALCSSKECLSSKDASWHAMIHYFAFRLT
jgi:hypothetical protein